MMPLGMGVVQSQRMLLGGQIVSEYQIQLEQAIFFTGNGGDGVVRLSVGFRQNTGGFIRISAPAVQDVCSQIHQTLVLFMTDTDYRQRPFHDACFYILKTRNGHGFLYGSRFHGKGIVSALEMVVA